MQRILKHIDIPERKRGHALAGALIAAVMALTGCAELTELPIREEPDPGPADVAPEFSYKQVVDLLHEGKAARAEVMLRSRLDAMPGDSQARELLQQIEASPEEYLGESGFQYEVRPGESLSVLAQRFLGNYRLFYILARYNDIDTPSMLQSGQMIRIPSDYWEGPDPSREPLDREIRARQYLESDRPLDALRLYDNARPEALGHDELTLLATLHRRWIERALDNADLDEARERLGAARRQAPDNGSWEHWLGALENRIAAESAYRDGMAARSRSPVAAARALQHAVQADPGHARARDALAALREQVVPELHREAVILYRNQNLDEAIRLWERVLQIDPEYQPAEGYRARALELRQRLDELD